MSPTKYPRYPAYRESGVPWLGEIPAHWEVKRLKYLCSVNPTVGNNQKTTEDSVVSFLPMEAIGEGFIWELQSRNLSDVKQGYTPFVEGDILVAKITPCFENGKGTIAIGLHNGIGFGTTELHVLRPNNEVNNRFLHYITISSLFRKHGEASMQGAAGQKRVTDSFVSNFYIPIPPLAEQRAIADYLDRETGRVDELVAKYRRLLALLDERRTSLISQAVTKGLDPTAPRQDTGVPWLGEIPAHWEVTPLQRIAKIVFSNVDKHSKEGEQEVLLCNYVDVYKNNYITSLIDFMKATASAEEVKKFTLRKDDVLITKDSESWNDIALPAHVVEEMNNVLCGYHLAMIRPNPSRVIGRFLYYSLLARPINFQFEVEATGITRYGIDQYSIGKGLIPLPPLAEQRAIADYLDRETGRIDQMKATINRLMDALQEYRASLISHVVTGKIRVTHPEGER